MCVCMQVYHIHTHTNPCAHTHTHLNTHYVCKHDRILYAQHTDAQEEAAQGMTPWFEGIGLVPQDAKDFAAACVSHNIFCVLSLCMMPEDVLSLCLMPEEVHHKISCDGCSMDPLIGLRWKCKQCADYDLCNACYTSFCDNRDLHDASHAFEKKSLCEALDARPRGLRPFVPMIIKAARVSKETRELATLTPSNTTVREWLRHVGFDDSSAANIGSVLEARHMRSKGLVLAQEPAELELVAGKLPAPAKHAFLAVVCDARSQQQFTLGPPPRWITGKWSAPLKSYLNDLDVFDDSTVEEIEAVFGRDDLKIRCRWSLFAMEDSELISALTASKLPPIVQKTLISSFKVEVITNSVQIAKCSQNKT